MASIVGHSLILGPYVDSQETTEIIGFQLSVCMNYHLMIKKIFFNIFSETTIYTEHKLHVYINGLILSFSCRTKIYNTQ